MSLQEAIADADYFFAERAMMLVTVEIRHKRLYIPMLCDTGSPKTFICTTTLEQFGLETTTVEHIKIGVGQVSLRAIILDENCPITYRGLNILGSDLLRQLLPDMVPTIVSLINERNKDD